MPRPSPERDPVVSAARLAMLENTGLMDSPTEAAFDRMTRLASALLHAPVALVSLVDDHRQFFKSAVGLPAPWDARRETPLSHSFCQHVVRTGAPLVVDDATTHPLVKDNLAVPDLGVRAYAGVPLELSSGAVLGSFCVIDGKVRPWSRADVALLRDLAESVVTEVELRLAMQAQSDVLAIVSHDLKSPLTAIRLSTRTAQRHAAAAPPAVGRSLGRISAASERMHALVHQVLDHARLHARDFTLALADEQLGRLVAAAIDGAQPLAEDRQVTLRDACTDGDVQLHCDPIRLGQALANLVHNAVEHTPAGATVTVRTAVDADTVRIWIDDEGEGVPPDQRPHLFERGWRAQNQQRRGHGLGLYIAAKYVRAHRGTLAAGDAARRGASFQVTLPRRADAADAADPADASHAADAPGATWGAPLPRRRPDTPS